MEFVYFLREHVYEYMQFLRNVLEEADKLENYGAHICSTARNMLELFHVIYPTLHEQQANEFPYFTGKNIRQIKFRYVSCYLSSFTI